MSISDVNSIDRSNFDNAIYNLDDITTDEDYGIKIPPIKSDILPVISALEKQIPYKPTPCTITFGRCKCGVGFTDKLTNYCANCGQKLDWGKVEEN